MWVSGRRQNGRLQLDTAPVRGSVGRDRLLAALGLVGCTLFALPIVATWRSPGVPPTLQSLSAALLLLTAVRPGWGLLAVAALLPVSPYLSAILGAEVASPAAAEILLAPFLLAAGVRAALGRPQGTELVRPAVVLGGLIAIGGAVGLAERQQVTTWPLDFVRHLVDHLWAHYFADSADFVAYHLAAWWIEGLALAALAERLIRSGSAGRTALVWGGAAAAATSWLRLIQISWRRPEPFAAALGFLQTQRINTLFTDVNAAGSLYALCLVPAAWLAWRGGGRRSGTRQWLRGAGGGAAAVVIALALWMTHSRAADAGALVALASAWLASRRPARRTAAAAVGLAAVLLIVFVAVSPPSEQQVSSGRSLGIRWKMAGIALQITQEHPVFGIGLGEFRQASRAFVTPDVVTLFPETAVGENAHNNFLQILAELGIAGLLAFLWLLAAAARPLGRAWRLGRIDDLHLGLAGGVLAFLITCLAGHPFLTTEVLWVFLAALGVTAGLGPARPRPAVGAWSRRIAPAVTAAVLVAAPVRFWELRHQDLHRVAIGVGPPSRDAGGAWYRMAAARSLWFVPSAARSVRIPLRVTDDSPSFCRVHVDLDGAPANIVDVTAAGWQYVDLPLDPARAPSSSHRVELRTDESECRLMVGDLEIRE